MNEASSSFYENKLYDLFLSRQELESMTGYKIPSFQLRMLESLGIPAKRRPDNSVLVLRMHCILPQTPVTPLRPKLKSSK